MLRLKIKNFNMILTEKLPKYWHYHPEKNDKYEYLTGEKILPSNQSQMMEHVLTNLYISL